MFHEIIIDIAISYVASVSLNIFQHGKINEMIYSCDFILHRWGGCIVAIITKDKVSQFVDTLKKELDLCGIKDGFKLDDLVFPTEPNQGAAIYMI